jgi:hypothetical protein
MSSGSLHLRTRNGESAIGATAVASRELLCRIDLKTSQYRNGSSSPRLRSRGRRAARVPGSTLCPDATSNWTLWEGLLKEFGVLDDLFKLRSRCVTEAGELNAGDAANEKLTAEFLFESLNGCAQRRLCDIAPSRRPREVQLLAHRKEVGDFAQIHSILIAQGIAAGHCLGRNADAQSRNSPSLRA